MPHPSDFDSQAVMQKMLLDQGLFQVGDTVMEVSPTSAEALADSIDHSTNFGQDDMEPGYDDNDLSL